MKAILVLFFAFALQNCNDDAFNKLRGGSTSSKSASAKAENAEKKPTKDAGADEKAVDVLKPQFTAVGYAHTCVILDDATVECWGENNRGQLGIGSIDSPTQPRLSPVVVPALKAKQLALGEYLSCAIQLDDTVACWGYSEQGGLGLGAKLTSYSPAVIPGLKAKQIAAHSGNTCAIQLDSTVKCWGYNQIAGKSFGFFNSPDANIYVPTLIPNLQAKQIVLGIAHACVIALDDTVKCWGINAAGNLGLGNKIAIATYQSPGYVNPYTSPTSVPGLKAKQLAAGGDFTCAILLDDTVKCWGDNRSGEMGLGVVSSQSDFTDYTSPVFLPNLKAKQLALGISHACAILLDDSSVKCWGDNSTGELGLGSVSDPSKPVTVPTTVPNFKASQIFSRYYQTCANSADDNSLYCWGSYYSSFDPSNKTLHPSPEVVHSS